VGKERSPKRGFLSRKGRLSIENRVSRARDLSIRVLAKTLKTNIYRSSTIMRVPRINRRRKGRRRAGAGMRIDHINRERRASLIENMEQSRRKCGAVRRCLVRRKWFPRSRRGGPQSGVCDDAELGMAAHPGGRGIEM
jgi:hypothetical protein